MITMQSIYKKTKLERENGTVKEKIPSPISLLPSPQKRYLKSYLLSIFILYSFSAMSFQTAELSTMKDGIGAYGFPEYSIQLSDSIEMAYIDTGTGSATLIFIHGLSSYIRAWEKTIPELSSTYRCIAVDLPGYGKSSKGHYPGTMEFYADVIEEFSRKLKLKNVSLVGHSMGGQIAITAALKYPQSFKSLVLVAPAGFETFTEEEKERLRNFYTVESIVNTPEPQIRMNHKYNFYSMPPEVELWIQERLVMTRSHEFPVYAGNVVRSVAGMLDGPVFEKLNQVKPKVLVVYGEEDFLIPNRGLHPGLSTRQVADIGGNKLKKAQVVLIPQTGHFVHYENPAAFNKLVAGFVNRK
jgi:pimeloyl-ACP methyl ester carboxylesterase